MRRLAALLVAALVACTAASVRADDGSPHVMTRPDGEVDADVCPVCHNPDMSLQRTELETCTLCHVETTHGGSLEHVRAAPEKVREAMQGRPKDAVTLPLTGEGKIYCGTCHLYHGPAVLGEEWLTSGWVPPDRGFAGAVETGVERRWRALAQAFDVSGTAGSFAAEGTRQLRLPVDDGRLCAQCHGNLQ